MEAVRLGRSGLRVTPVSLGCMAFGRWIDEAASRRVFDAAVDAGVMLFDTADIYGRGMETGNPLQGGESEDILGRIMGEKRNRIVLATKGAGRTGLGPNDSGLSRYHLIRAVEASLKRLKTDTIDLYQVHRFDEHTPLDETMQALDDLVASGKIQYVGCSNFAAWQLAKANALADARGWRPFVSVQPLYNMLSRDIERELLPYALADGIGVIAYSPLARGVLTGKHRPNAADPASERNAAGDRALRRLLAEERSFRVADGARRIAEAKGWKPAKLAMRWLLDRPGVTTALVGASKPEHIYNAVEAAGAEPLTEAEHEEIENVCRNE